MKISKKNIAVLIYFFIFQLLILFISSYAICSDYTEYYKEVLMYGTDSDITNAFSKVRKNLGEDVNRLILNLFKENHDIKVYMSAVDYIKISKLKSAKDILVKELDRKPINEDYEEDIIVALSEINAKDSLNKLIDIFKEGNTSLRIKMDIIDAFGSLGKGNDEVENILINTVKDKKNKDDIRAHAVLSLGKIKSEKSIDLIRKILFNRYEKEIVRMYSTYSLKEIEGESATDDLASLINDKDPKVAEYATKALSDINSDKVGDVLIKALRSDYDIVRYYAVLGLKKLKYKKAYKILEFKSKYDSNPHVRQVALSALKEIKGESKLNTKKTDFKKNRQERVKER